MAYGDGDGVEGVGGWLAFFLVTLGIITPGASVIGVMTLKNEPGFAEFDALYPAALPAEWGLTILIIALCWFATYRFLAVHNWMTVRIGIATLAALLLISIIGEPLLISMVTGLDLGMLYSTTQPGELIRPFVYCGIWTAFLLNSVRVRNTYDRVSHEQAAEVFS